MAKDRSLVRASDLGAWTYCNRAWWLREVKGAEHSSPDVLDRGSAAHQVHGKQVRVAERLSTAGLILVAAGFVVACLFAFWWLVG
jgi:CRISPR/Cas system-associated exonuclease Cas4 (RecB family)